MEDCWGERCHSERYSLTIADIEMIGPPPPYYYRVYIQGLQWSVGVHVTSGTQGWANEPPPGMVQCVQPCGCHPLHTRLSGPLSQRHQISHLYRRYCQLTAFAVIAIIISCVSHHTDYILYHVLTKSMECQYWGMYQYCLYEVNEFKRSWSLM